MKNTRKEINEVIGQNVETMTSSEIVSILNFGISRQQLEEIITFEVSEKDNRLGFCNISGNDFFNYTDEDIDNWYLSEAVAVADLQEMDEIEAEQN